MKKMELSISILVLFWLMMPLASAYILDIGLTSQDPIPVNNGDVFEVFFKADIKDTRDPPEDLLVKIFPEYPFSLTAKENDTREFGNVASVGYDGSFTFKYRLLVDENANEGDNEIKISVYIVVTYGVNIPYVAGQVQENVRRNVEKMTGLTLSEVDVSIQGVTVLAKETAEDKEKEKAKHGGQK